MGSTGEVWRIEDAFLAQILEGMYPCGLNPSAEVELAAELGCSRSTALLPSYLIAGRLDQPAG